jgi:CRP/FNR family transcriptional regulator, cyclic AMP receptor protein
MTGTSLFNNEPDVRTFAAGQVIFEEGDPGDLMFAVVQGEVDVFKAGEHLRTLTLGDIFGEMSLIDDAPRSATALAKTACKLAAIDKKRFMLLVQQTPFFAIQMMQILTERLRKNEEI